MLRSAVSSHLRAKQRREADALLPPPLGAAGLAAVGFALGARNRWTLLALFFGGFTAQVRLSVLLLPVRQRLRAHGEGAFEAFRQARRRGPRRFGAYIVHAGAMLVIVAIAVSSTMGASKEVELRERETTTLGGYTLTFVKAERIAEPHRVSVRARMDVSRNGQSLGILYPRMNQYESQREPIGTPAVRTSLSEDLYLSVHTIDPESGTVGLLILVTPMVAWIWLATAVMALGGLVALVPSRRGETVVVKALAPAPAAATPEGSH